MLDLFLSLLHYLGWALTILLSSFLLLLFVYGFARVASLGIYRSKREVDALRFLDKRDDN